MSISLEDFEREALDALCEFATIRSLSPHFDEEWHEHGEIDRAADFLADWARSRHLGEFTVSVQRISGRTPMIVIDVAATAPSSGTVVLYGHLDKQPPLGEWSEGLDPFQPVRRDNRVFARGIADDGYAIFAALLALEDLERRSAGHARCIVLIEASEESGSPDLIAHLDALGTSLGDVQLLVCLDSGAFTYDRLWVTTSLRGVLIATLTVEVLERGQHSGSASGVVPSSFRILRQLLDRLEDPVTGEIRLRDLHGEIPDVHRDAARRVTQEFGDVAGDEQPVVPGLVLMGSSAVDRLLQRTWAPTLSVTGVGGVPAIADAGNVLRPSTTMKLSLRLPPNVRANDAIDAVQRVLTTEVPSHARVRLSCEAADGWLSPPLSPWLTAALHEASERAFGTPAEFAGEGGTIPFLAVLGERFPKVQFVATGVLGPGSNAHGIDEMLDLDMVVGVTNAVAHLIGAHASASGSDD